MYTNLSNVHIMRALQIVEVLHPTCFPPLLICQTDVVFHEISCEENKSLTVRTNNEYYKIKTTIKISKLSNICLTGSISCNVESLKWLLTQNGKGNLGVIVPGGAVEALDAHPGTHRLNLKEKKGFIKKALQFG